MGLRDSIRSRISEARNLLDEFDARFVDQIAEVADMMVEAYKSNQKTIFMGNGGSAADSQHLVTELVGRFLKERSSLESVSLSANIPLITALGNDYGYEHIFRRQIEAIANEGDVVIGLSTSGESENVLEALREANARGCRTVGMTGRSGGKIQDIVDICLCSPASISPRIQENHILIGHIICELVEEQLFGDQ